MTHTHTKIFFHPILNNFLMIHEINKYEPWPHIWHIHVSLTCTIKHVYTCTTRIRKYVNLYPMYPCDIYNFTEKINTLQYINHFKDVKTYLPKDIFFFWKKHTRCRSGKRLLQKKKREKKLFVLYLVSTGMFAEQKNNEKEMY